MTRLKELVPPWSYGDWQPKGDPFGEETDGVVVPVMHSVHIAASLEAMDKKGFWRPITTPVLIHSPEVKKNYRLPLLLRVALYGQSALDEVKGIEHVLAPEQESILKTSASMVESVV